MDYEKKYKEAQKWIESIYSELSHEQQMEAEAFFPELKESEDEKMMHQLHSWMKEFADAENELKAIQVVGCKKKCEECEFYHQNDPDYPDNCEYPDNPPCNE